MIDCDEITSIIGDWEGTTFAAANKEMVILIFEQEVEFTSCESVNGVEIAIRRPVHDLDKDFLGSYVKVVIKSQSNPKQFWSKENAD